MLKRIVIGLVALCSTASMASADLPWLEIEGRQWRPKLSADARYTDDDAGTGTDIDFKDELGLKDENFWGGKIALRLCNHKLRLAYTKISYEGAKIVTEEIEFGDETYVAGTRVLTDFDMHYAQFGWIWQFINIGNDTFKLGTVLDIKGFDVKASLEAPDLDTSENAKAVFGLPTLGLALDINPTKWLTIYGEGAGLTAGKYGWFLDAEVGLKIRPIHNLSIIGGYRLFRLDVESDDDFLDLDIRGPFAGLVLNF